MGAIGYTFLSASIFTSPLENNLLLSKQKYASMKSLCYVAVVSRNPSKLSRVSCKLSGSGIEEKPTSINGVSNSKNRMEEYNTAMKSMMRNPYEYHHDLGGFLSRLQK